jgi:NhaP-type Na+/H+ or K+/H+ antiporter
MSATTLIALALVVFGWSVGSEWFAERNLSGPLLFLGAGLLLANPSWGVVSVDVESATVHHLAEITLALLLFADASAVPLAAARRDLPLTARLLGLGLPLTFALGIAVALVVFPSLPVALAGLIAASLAPTDAALSASLIADERLPLRVRRVLNVESGLNDGIATPVVTFCIASAATALGVVGHTYDSGVGAFGELAIGIATGALLALVGGGVVRITHARGWMDHGSRRLATLALAVMAFLIAGEVGGNPFVAAFIGGLVFGASARADAPAAVELTDLTGTLLSLVLWFIFGAGFVVPAFEEIDLRTALYAILSLTVVRMLPVAISLLGSGSDRRTTAFIGWFGPRGLASVVFALLAVEELGAPEGELAIAVHTIAITIVCSVVAHGVTARPFASRYIETLAPGGRPATP